MYKFTIFTPSFNRAYSLGRVFNSLMTQTIDHRDFEWILIDDGSTDNTAELAKEFQIEADFTITYLQQENKGKQACHNRAIKLAQGTLFCVVDSDDYIASNALKTFWQFWQTLNAKQQKVIVGIGCRCQDRSGNIIGHPIETGLQDDHLKWSLKNNINFDVWAALNTQVFKQHLFPEISGIKFIPESYLWDQVGNQREILIIGQALYTRDYQDDGFTKNIIYSYHTHAKGRYIYHNFVISNLFFTLIKYNRIRLIKDFIQAARLGFHANYKIKKMLSNISNPFKKVLFLLLSPMGLFFYKRDAKFLKKNQINCDYS